MKKFATISLERVKAYWNKRPCNIRHSPLKVGTKEYFDEVEERKYFVEPHISSFAQFCLWRNKDVLEIGCGIGTDTINFARAKARITAIDISYRSIQIARKRAKIYELNNIKFQIGNAEQLTQFLSPRTYDLVYSFGTIHHTPNPERAIQQLRYYSHSRTVLKIMVYNRYSWKILHIFLTNTAKFIQNPHGLITKYSEAQKNCPVTHTFSKWKIKKMLERNGFRVRRIWIDHIFPYDIPHYQNHEYQKVWYFKYMPVFVFRMLERTIGWHICITAEVK